MDSTPLQRINRLCDDLTHLITSNYPGNNTAAQQQVRQMCFEIRSLCPDPEVAQYTDKLERAARGYFSGNLSTKGPSTSNQQDKQTAAYSMPQRIREHVNHMHAEGGLE